jgi:hypothetical protein
VEKSGGSCYLCRLLKKQVNILMLSVKFFLAAANFIDSAPLNVLAILAKSGGRPPVGLGERNLANRQASCGRVVLQQN